MLRRTPRSQGRLRWAIVTQTKGIAKVGLSISEGELALEGRQIGMPSSLLRQIGSLLRMKFSAVLVKKTNFAPCKQMSAAASAKARRLPRPCLRYPVIREQPASAQLPPESS
jgi:hypothetical protein